MFPAFKRSRQAMVIAFAGALICTCALLLTRHRWSRGGHNCDCEGGGGGGGNAFASEHPTEDHRSVWPSNSSDRIPCLVHQSWKTSRLPSARTRRYRATWLACMPSCRHRLWTDDDNRRLVASQYRWLLPVYDGLAHGVQRADLVRYVYMLHYGGIYVDIDSVCQRDFRHLLRPWGLAFGGMDGHWVRSVNGTYVQNSFMASEPGHPFWLGLLLRVVRRHRHDSIGGAEERTGPLILMEELQQYIDSGQKDVKIFPASYFNPFSWITNRRPQCKTHGAMSEADEAACIGSFPDAFVVQMHSKSWGGGEA